MFDALTNFNIFVDMNDDVMQLMIFFRNIKFVSVRATIHFMAFCSTKFGKRLRFSSPFGNWFSFTKSTRKTQVLINCFLFFFLENGGRPAIRLLVGIISLFHFFFISKMITYSTNLIKSIANQRQKMIQQKIW